MPDALVRGRWVITDPAKLPLEGLAENAAIVIEGGTVKDVGDYVLLKRRYPDLLELGTPTQVVLPGLIDSHTHGRGLTQIQLGAVDDYLEPWILDYWSLKPLDIYIDTLHASMKLIRSGVTTILHAGYAREWGKLEEETRASLRAYESIGLRVAYAMETLDRHTFVYQDDEEFLASLPSSLGQRVKAIVAELGSPVGGDFFTFVEKLAEEYADHPRIKILLMAEGPEWCSDELLSRIRAVATALRTGVHLHALESPHQREFLSRVYGSSTFAHLEELRFLDEDVSVAHAVWLTDVEMDTCASRGVSVCHNASSNLRLRVGILPVARLLEKGVNVAIGTDGATLNDDDDFLQEMRLVSKLHRLPRGLSPAPCPTSFDVLKMATVNGARATTFGSTIGNLLPGSKADVVIIDYKAVSEPYVDPRVNVVDALLYRARRLDVDTVIIGGQIVLADGKFVGMNEDEVLSELAAVAEAEPDPRFQRWVEMLSELRPHVAAFYTGWDMPRYEPYYNINSKT